MAPFPDHGRRAAGRREASREANAGDADIGEHPVFVFGDVHGRADLLGKLLDRFDAQADGRALLVGLGDYIDRGPGGREVVDMLLAAERRLGPRAVWLRGNHEQMLLDFIENPSSWPTWKRHGADSTLASYGVSLEQGDVPLDGAAIRDALVEAMPPTHLALISSTRLHLIQGDYIFVHAGLNPDVDIVEQTPGDILWRRDDDGRSYRGRTVVHGHTPRRRPSLEGDRLAIDTGAYATGVLTGVWLERRRREFIEARLSPDEVAPSAWLLN